MTWIFTLCYFKIYIYFVLDQRGITQEVSLVTKHGVETKNYDSVSIYFKLSKNYD